MKVYLKKNWIYIIGFSAFWIILTVIRVKSYVFCQALAQYETGLGSKTLNVILFALFKYSLFLLALFIYDRHFNNKPTIKRFKLLIFAFIAPLILTDSIYSTYNAYQLNNVKNVICQKSDYEFDRSISEQVLESKGLTFSEYEYIREIYHRNYSYPEIPESSTDINIKCIQYMGSGDLVIIDFTCDSCDIKKLENGWIIIENEKNRITITNGKVKDN